MAHGKDGLADNLVSIAKGNAFSNHIVGNIGGRGEATCGSFPHVVCFNRELGDHIGKYLETAEKVEIQAAEELEQLHNVLSRCQQHRLGGSA